MTRAALNPPELAVTARRSAEATVLDVSGELDIATAEEFVAAVGRHLDDGRPVMLDLRGLSFADSCGVRALDAIVRDADRRAARLTIGTTLQSGVRQVLELTGLMAVLPLAEIPDAGG